MILSLLVVEKEDKGRVEALLRPWEQGVEESCRGLLKEVADISLESKLAKLFKVLAWSEARLATSHLFPRFTC